MSDLPTVTWHGCYDDSWKDIITPESFAHPAKMARGLLTRILDFMLAEGWIKRGDTVLDVFAGVGTTGIEAASRGLRFVGVELEPRFARMAWDNFELHQIVWEQFGDPLPQVIEGDSRRLAELLGQAGSVEAVVGSPPYAESLHLNEPQEVQVDRLRAKGKLSSIAKISGNSGSANHGYGSSPGQLGALPPGSVDAVVGSPPYATSNVGNDDGENELRRLEAKAGTGQLGPEHERIVRRGVNPNAQLLAGGYGQTPGQLGALPPGSVDAVVGSPPYAESLATNIHTIGFKEITGNLHRKPGATSPSEVKQDYGSSPGQLGSESPTSFWEAARDILLQCYAVLRPGTYCAWVTKDFVKDKARVPFSEQWLRLCMACGFEPVLWVRASLVTDNRENGLFGEKVGKKKERKSFFRRLAEKKGSPRIDHEDVLFVRRVVGTLTTRRPK